MADSIIFREEVLIDSKKLSVGDNFDVNNTVVIAALIGNVTGMGSLGCGSVTSTGALSTDNAAFTTDGAGNISACGTIASDAITSSGDVEGSILTDGTISISAGK